MDKRKLAVFFSAIGTMVIFSIGMRAGYFYKECNPVHVYHTDTVFITHEDVSDTLNLKNVHTYLKSLAVKYDTIVMKQIVQETGWLKSNACRNKNNLFGFTTSDGLMRFKSWKESVRYYALWQLRKYTDGDYYNFLIDVNYASDSNYINTLKSIDLYR
jgi:hypothetical protein